MQISRLFEIVTILMEKSVTAAELAAHFEVSVRTVYRDIETLCQAGIPIYMTRGRGGGIRLLGSYVLDKSLLSDSERKEILSALQGFKAANPDTDAVLRKMSALFGMHDTSWIEVDFSDWGNMQRGTFEKIKQAVIERRAISFDYYNSTGSKTHRTAEPLQLWFKDKAWYLKAFCRAKQQFRVFKLTRIKALEVLHETFDRTLPDAAYPQDSRPMPLVTLTLLFDAGQAFRIYDEFSEDEITQTADGGFEVTVTFPEGDWVVGYILSFGDNVRVIAPQRIQSAVKAKLHKALNQYL